MLSLSLSFSASVAKQWEEIPHSLHPSLHFNLRTSAPTRHCQWCSQKSHQCYSPTCSDTQILWHCRGPSLTCHYLPSKQPGCEKHHTQQFQNFVTGPRVSSSLLIPTSDRIQKGHELERSPCALCSLCWQNWDSMLWHQTMWWIPLPYMFMCGSQHCLPGTLRFLHSSSIQFSNLVHIISCSLHS